MAYNKKPMMMTEGQVFVDGLEIFDNVKFEIKFTPDVWIGKVIGERSPSTRWKGFSVTGSVTRRRSTPWLKEIVERYQKDGVVPEMTIQGVMNDKDSDYYAQYGNCTVTAVGCIITGDLTLLALDTGGDTVDDVISFNAKDVIF